MSVAKSTKLRTGRRFDQRRKTLSSEKKNPAELQLKIGKGIKTPNCRRPKGTKARNDKWKESKSNRGIKLSMLSILDLLLLN